MKTISFEGSIGSGKTSLTNFFAHEFNCAKVLEDFEANRDPQLDAAMDHLKSLED